jgi:hypothetical protein
MPKVKKEYHLRFMVDDTTYDRYHDSQELLAERFKSVQEIYRERCTLVYLREYNPTKHPKKEKLKTKKKPDSFWPGFPKGMDW